jgi:acyl-CoA thioester hydrolase
MRGHAWRYRPSAYPFQLEIATRFEDMDPNRHLNNTAIARLCEETRVRFHAHMRSSFRELGHPRFLVARVEIDYLAEGQYPVPVSTGLGVVSVGGKSYCVGLGLFQGGSCIALSDAVMVFRGEGGPAAIPDSLRAALMSFALRQDAA